MAISFDKILQYLQSILAQDAQAEEKIKLVEAWLNAAHKHVNDLYVGEENEQEKRTKKEEEKEVLNRTQSSGSSVAHEASNNSPRLEKLSYMTPEDIRRKVKPEFVTYIEETWLLPKYPGLMTDMQIPLCGAQYLSWLTHHPQAFIDQKLASLEQHPTHYDRNSVAGTINDWIKRDLVKMNAVQRKQWNATISQQKPQILAMINNNLKPKRNGKQATINFDAAGVANGTPEATAAKPADGDHAAQHPADN